MKLFFTLLFTIICLSASEKPNIIFILVDDMGYSDLGCYGGEINTPNIDSLADNGLRYTQMYNTAKCFPSRACLLTGVYAQQSGMDKKHAKMLNSATLGEGHLLDDLKRVITGRDRQHGEHQDAALNQTNVVHGPMRGWIEGVV